MTLRAAELEVLLTGNDKPLDKTLTSVEKRTKALTDKPTEMKVDADVRTALASVGRLEDRVRRADGTVDVDADTSAAEEKIRGLSETAAEAGDEGGKAGGAALVGGIVGALATIPIAGAVAGIAQTVGEAVVEGFQNGLAVEVRADRLAATTDLGEAAVGRLARAAGESYADNFGESVEANMTTARDAVQRGLLDPKDTQRDAQEIIASISGVADLVEDETSRVSRSTTQLIRTGLARNAQEAFDIIVAGQQAGLNASEDWLDTIDEYSTQWRNLGLEAPQVLGLLNQAVRAGARDTDVAADALKEFSIRARDVEDTGAREAFEDLGFSADEMQQKVAGGRRSAAEALDQTLDRLRKIEDPAKRNAAAVKLFGTQAEDLGDALFAMDLDTAADQFDNLEGRASRALSTLADNTAGDLQTAQRNIDLAVQSIQGALASAFSDEISGVAEFVSENREAVVGFLLDAANAGLDLGRALVESAAAGTEAFGDFASETLPALLGGINGVVQGLGRLGLVTDEEAQDFADFTAQATDDLEKFDKSTERAADAIRTNIIDNALDPAQDKLNEFGATALSDARLSDSTKRLANDIADVGYAADGSKKSLEHFDGELDTSTKSGARLDEQIRGVVKGLRDQVRAASDAGESQSDLRERAASARQAFIDQVAALGLTREEARKLANDYGLIPRRIVTEVDLDLRAAQAALAEFRASATVRATLDDGRTRAGFSGGGAISGPGTGTSDDVLIAASNGEHMLTAEEVQRAGGHGAIYRLRAAIRAGVAKFRDGGAIGDASDDVRRWRRELERARAAERRARGTSREDAAERRVDRTERRLDEARDRLFQLRDAYWDTRRELRRGEIRDSVTGSLSGALGVTDDLRDLAGDIGGGWRSRSLRRTANRGESALTRLYRDAERVEQRLDRATRHLEKWQQIADNVSSSIRDGFSLGSVTGGVNPWSGEEQAATGLQLLAATQEYEQKANTLVEKMRQLQDAGYGTRILQEVAAQGVDGGIAMADALLQLSPEDARALRSSSSGIIDVAGQIGVIATNGNLTTAQAAVDAAEAQARMIDKNIDKWARKLGKEMAKALGIKPRALGGPTVAGSAYLVGEDGPELRVESSAGYIVNTQKTANMLRGGGPSVTHNWHITNVHPVAEPPSVTAARAARSLARTGR